jgi:renalase
MGGIKSIAVVGAGLAGLTAARMLHEAGHRVQIFEKGRAVGGRLATSRTAEAAFDHGAPYFTAQDERFRQEIEACSREGNCAAWHAKIAPEFARGAALRNAEDPWFVGTPALSDIASGWSAGLNISLLTEVRSVKRDGASWKLLANDGENLGVFDIVLVATTAPEAVPLLPPGSLLRFAVEQIVVLPCWTVMLEYADNLPLCTDAGQPEDDMVAWLTYDTSKPERRKDAHRWVLQATTDWSVANLLSSEQQVAAEMLQRLVALCGESRLPEPRRVRAHRWRYALVDGPLGRSAEFDPAFGIGVAGDWCLGSSVEAAYLSGRALAESVLEQVRPS